MTHTLFKDYLEVIMLLVGVSTVIWQVSKVQSNLLETVDKVSDQNYIRFAELDTRLRVHIAECTAKERHVNTCLRELKLRTEIEKDGRN